MLNDKDFLDKVSGTIGKDLSKMSLKERQQVINRSRNYLRFKMTKLGIYYIPSSHPLLTSREAEIVLEINRFQDRLEKLKCQFYSEFYDSCPKVGSTLKRKPKKIPGLITLTEEEIINFI